MDVEIKVVKEDGEAPFTVGGKIKLKIVGSEEKVLPLNVEGKAYLHAQSPDLNDKKISIQLEDTNFYRIIRHETDVEKTGITVKATVLTQTIDFSGRVVKSDMQPVNLAILDFGNGIAKATTNANGEYTVKLPKNIVNTSIRISFTVNDKTLYNEYTFVNEKRLRLLKVP